MNTEIIATIQQLLKGRNLEFDNAKKIKLVRHKDSRPMDERKIQGEPYTGSLYNLYRNEYERFLKYQNEQRSANFINVEYIVAFIGEDGTDSRFIGVYKNNGVVGKFEDHHIFDFEEVPGFEILKERVVVDWGKNAISWHQWYENEKAVIRIDRGLIENDIPLFISYNDVLLTYRQLKTIFDKEIADWKRRLDCCNCIYLIQDTNNGKQYIGSTYNKEGIWGRWKDYAESGHGDDVLLKKEIDKDPLYAMKYFHWIILELLPLKISENEAIDREKLWKRKLCSLSLGYNKN
ncbi:MAG: GIY-YIG nuclease family protein [Spirochaetia bacterium]|jgi:hypothetical protein|nr:GIY-YIG nuclease family protein [Spirochaetia bacterium]MBR4684147.1 GIY-YIG nuclease family protein [Spirochaetia bacterium]